MQAFPLLVMPRARSTWSMTGVTPDEFAFDSEGSIYLTTHVFQSLLKIRNNGVRTRIAGRPTDRAVAGTTAAAFRRTPLDRTILYATTNGGMTNPVDGEVGPPRVLSIDVGRTADIRWSSWKANPRMMNQTSVHASRTQLREPPCHS